MKKPAIDLAGMETAETLARLRAQRVIPSSPRFFQWMWTMATDPSLTDSEKWHATVLALFSDWDTGENCCPSRGDVSALTGLKERTIQEHMRKFKSLGMVATNTPGRGRPLTSKLLLSATVRVASNCHPNQNLGSIELPPYESLGGNQTDSLGGNQTDSSLPNSGNIATTLKPDAREGSPEEEETTPTTAPAKPTRADDWREALARNRPPAEPRIDFKKDYDELAEALFTTANGAMARGLPGLEVLSEPLRWLEGGCDMDLDILPVIKARAAKAAPGSIRSWGYFGAAVFEAKAVRTAPPPEAKPIDIPQRPVYVNARQAAKDKAADEFEAYKIKYYANRKEIDNG